MLKRAAYSESTITEKDSISVLRSILYRKIIPKFEEMDRTPNSDGILTILNEENTGIAKIEVQVKTLPKKYQTRPRYQLDLSLFDYAHYETLYPFVLICVDIERKIAYWILIDEILLKNLNIKFNQKSKVITFPKENIIDGKNIDYVIKWCEIYQSYRAKKTDVDYNKLKDDLTYFLGIKKEIKNVNYHIHIFLDKLNEKLNTDFNIIKKIKYPYVWNLGFAYSHFNDDEVIYSLYPIRYDENEKQIKHILNKQDIIAIRETYGSRAIYKRNPIIKNPIVHAYSVIEDMNKDILKRKKLYLECNEFINLEYSSHYIYANYKSLYLDRYENTIVDTKKEIRNIIENSFNKIEVEYDDNHLDRLSLGHMNYSFKTFVHAVNYLDLNHINKIKNPYENQDYARLERKGGLIFNTYSPNMLENSLKIYYMNYYTALKDVIKHNYSSLYNELNIHDDFNKIIILYKAKEHYDKIKDMPWVKIFLLKSTDNIDIKEKIEIFPIDSKYNIEFDPKKYKQKIEYNGDNYILKHFIMQSASFIYHEFPLFNAIYKEIEDILDTYFKYHHKKLI